MERKGSPSLLQRQGFNVKSSFISQYSPEGRERTATQLTSRKQLSSSTFLDLEESKAKFLPRKPTRREAEYLPHAHPQLARARSLKDHDPKFKSLQVIQEPQLDPLNETTLRLRAEELVFKLKVRLGSLLGEAGASEQEVARFGQLTRADELILFVGERVRHALEAAARQAAQTAAATARDREALEKAQGEAEQLRGRLAEREAGERAVKAKLRESHAELKELYDRVNLKEKEYSQRTTELYQLRLQLKEHDKAADALRARLAAADKDRAELRLQLETANKTPSAELAVLREERAQAMASAGEAREEAERARERAAQVGELNALLKEELTRWRERAELEGERESESSSEAHTPNDLGGAALSELKKSTMSMNSAYIARFTGPPAAKLPSLTALEIDNARLRLQLAELHKQNSQLHRALLNAAPLKLKYDQALAEAHTHLAPSSEQLRHPGAAELEGEYRRRTEQVAREWKEKLFEIVSRYEDEAELLRAEIAGLRHDCAHARQQACQLASEKCQAETRLIEADRQLHAIARPARSLLALPHREDTSQDRESEGKSSEELIASSPRLLPIQEEESPRKCRPDELPLPVSIFNIREESPSQHTP